MKRFLEDSSRKAFARRKPLLARSLFLLVSLLLPSGALAGALEFDPDQLRPGLLADYRSLVDAEAKLQRIELKPAFTLGHSSPHPRLPSGPFEVVWTGLLQLQESSPITFSAFVSGELAMKVDASCPARTRAVATRVSRSSRLVR